MTFVDAINGSENNRVHKLVPPSPAGEARRGLKIL
jgi:hypothetical protein